MLRPNRGRLTSALLVVLAVLGLDTARAHAQANLPMPKRVRIETFDKVDLAGTLYQSGKATAPCVVILHSTEGNRKQAGYDELAKKLQENYTVLTFDFRGHGDSTDVQMEFWDVPENQKLKGAKASKNTISYKDFPPNYWPMLVNDVAAAKRFLDRQNDANLCNSSNTVIVGAGDGAALGAYFIASEWLPKQKTAANPANPFLIPAVPQAGNETAVAGRDYSAAVWLSITKDVKRTNIPAYTWFTALNPPLRDKVPMCFIYGEQDSLGKTYSEHLKKGLKYKNEKQKFTGDKPIEKTKLAGRDLLKPSLPTEAFIFRYINEVLDAVGTNAVQKKDVENQRLTQVPSNILTNRGQ